MATWKMKQDGINLSTAGRIMVEAFFPVSAFKDRWNNIYYTENPSNNLSLRRIDAITNLETTIASAIHTQGYYSYNVAYYYNPSTSADEYHFLIPKDVNKNYPGATPYCFKVVTSSSTSATVSSLFYPTGAALIPTALGNFSAIANGSAGGEVRYDNYLTINGTLYVIYQNSTTQYSIYKYVPNPVLASSAWITVTGLKTMPAGVSMVRGQIGVWNIGSKIYMCGSATTPYGIMHAFWFDLNDGTTSAAISTPTLRRNRFCPFTVGSTCYLIGGYDNNYTNNQATGAPTVVSFTTSGATGDGYWTDTGISNSNFIAVNTENALDIGGELQMFGGFTSASSPNNAGITTLIQKFTFVLDDISNFTALYIPGIPVSGIPNKIRLKWLDSSDEGFYVVERSKNGEGYVKISEIQGIEGAGSQISFDDPGYDDATQQTTTEIDLVNNNYTYRVKAAIIITV